MQPSHGLTEANQRLQLSHSVAIGGLVVRLTQFFVLVLEDQGTVPGELGLEGACDLDVGLQLRHSEVWLQCLIL